MEARRVELKVFYNGVINLAPFVTVFSYTDNSDKTDDISISLADRDDLWISDYFPETGATLNVIIKVINWNFENDNRELDLGKFEIDQVTFSDTITINAVSVPITSSIRSEKKNKGWENISLSSICAKISSSAGLVLNFDTDINPYYDRKDQSNISDLEFIEGLCKSDGLCLKVSNSNLIVYEEAKYDIIDSAITITRGKSNIIGMPSFQRNAKNIYKACEITYFDSNTDKSYRGYFEVSAHTGHILKLQEQFNGKSDDVNLDRKAKARLREQNKNEWKLSFTMVGDIIYFAGMNVDIVGWKKFDGKYHIESVSHSYGSGGYSVGIECRKCLDGY